MTRWIWPALCVVCLGVGILLGSSFEVQDVRTDSHRRSIDDATGRAREPSQPGNDFASPPRDTRPSPAGADPIDSVQPVDGESVESDDGKGVIEVDLTDFEGPCVARVDGTDLAGEPDFEEHEGEHPDRITFEVVPGRYTVSWTSTSAVDRYRAPVTVEAGKRTRVMASDARYRVTALPTGRGVFNVVVAGTGGLARRRGVGVTLSAPSFTGRGHIHRTTNAEGACQFILRGGSYELSVGAYERTLVVEAGRSMTHEVRHGDQGDVEIQNPQLGRYRLVPESGRSRAWALARTGVSSPTGFYFVPAGAYRLEWLQQRPPGVALAPRTAAPGWQRLGELVVPRASHVRFPHDLAPSRLKVVFKREGLEAKLVSSRGRSATLSARLISGKWIAVIEPLEPGKYTIEVRDGDRLRTFAAWVGIGETALLVDVPKR